jgi:endonuclease/exonuclease/phosphatase family metal-dependent hydrolase
VTRATLAALVAVVAAAACNHPRPRSIAVELRPNRGAVAPKDGAFRLVTYNVHMIEGAKIAAALKSDPILIAADVIMMQEVNSHPDEGASRACLAARQLAMHCAYAPGYGLDDGGSHGVAILSKWRLTDTRVIEQPYHDVVFNSARRAALAATIHVAGTPVRLFAVHLDNRINPGDRKKQLAPVLDVADKHAGPVVVAGDMNTTPFVWLAGFIPLPAGVQDNRLEAYVRKRGYATPVVGSGPTHQYMSMRLDAVYTRGMVASAHGVVSTVRASDHLPLWVDLAVGDQARVAACTNGDAASSCAATRNSTSSRP